MIGLDQPFTGPTAKKEISLEIIGCENKRNPIISCHFLGHDLHLKFDAQTKLLHVRESDIPVDIRNIFLEQIKSNSKIKIDK